MAVSHVMTAAHLQKFQVKWDYGVPYHFTEASRVQELVDLVTRAAVPCDYNIPTSGTAFLRLNTIIKEAPNKESWIYGGGALVSPDVKGHIEDAKRRAVAEQPDKEVKDTLLTAYVLNEWERFSVVFELVITIGAKQ